MCPQVLLWFSSVTNFSPILLDVTLFHGSSHSAPIVMSVPEDRWEVMPCIHGCQNTWSLRVVRCSICGECARNMGLANKAIRVRYVCPLPPGQRTSDGVWGKETRWTGMRARGRRHLSLWSRSHEVSAPNTFQKYDSCVHIHVFPGFREVPRSPPFLLGYPQNEQECHHQHTCLVLIHALIEKWLATWCSLCMLTVVFMPTYVCFWYLWQRTCNSSFLK